MTKINTQFLSNIRTWEVNQAKLRTISSSREILVGFASAVPPNTGLPTFLNVTNTSPAEYSGFRSAVVAAFTEWTKVSSLRMRLADVNAGEVADIQVVLGSFGAANSGAATKIVNTEQKIYVAISTRVFTDAQLNGAVLGTAAFRSIVHEFGHAIGLSHPNEGDEDLKVPRGSTTELAKLDVEANTIMAYPNDPSLNPLNVDRSANTAFASTLNLYDVAAVQAIYGENAQSSVANPWVFSAWDGSPNSVRSRAVWGNASPADEIDASGISQRSFIDLRPGAYNIIGSSAFSPGSSNSPIDSVQLALARGYALTSDGANVGIAFGSTGNQSIEIAKGGAGNDVLIGNDVANTLRGNGGNDVLDGGVAANAGTEQDGVKIGAGRGDGIADNLIGGAGADTFKIRLKGGNDVVDADGTNDKIDAYNEDDKSAGLVKFVVATGAPGTYKSTDGRWRYTQNSPLQIVDIQSGETLATVLDFEDNDFGIHLQDAQAAPSAPVRTFTGDTQDFDSNAGEAGIQPTDDGFGNSVRTTEVVADRADSFKGSTADEVERFDTAGGDDVVDADGTASATSTSGGRDLIYAGAGNDVVRAGGNDDWVEGGDGSDILSGNSGGDVLFGISAGTVTTLNADSLADLIAAGNVAPDENAPTPIRDWLAGGTGDDWLIGGGANDALMGGLGSDVLVGGAGNDYLYSDGDLVAQNINWSATVDGQGNRVFLGTTGTLNGNSTDGAADLVYGGLGNDEIFSGAGDDAVYGEAGDDSIAAGLGSDVVYGGDGDDFIFGESLAEAALAASDTSLATNDYLDGGDGNDTLFGMAGSDSLYGGAGTDTLNGDEASIAASVQGDDYLDGGAGDDFLYGEGGNDTLVGGAGVDVLQGGAGKDTYVFNVGDVVGDEFIDDTIDASNSAEASVIVFGDGIERSQITFGVGSLVIDLGGGNRIHLEGFDQSNPNATPLLDSIQFADGTSMSYQDVLDQGFDLDGTEDGDVIVGTGVTDLIDAKGGDDLVLGLAGDDTILGGAGADTVFAAEGDDTVDGGEGNDNLDGADGADSLSGGAGNDTLEGGSGNDSLTGGTGNDILRGGAGDDSYAIASGDGIDVLDDIEGADTIQFGAGITADSITGSLINGTDGGLYLSLQYGVDDYLMVRQSDSHPGASTATFSFATGESLTQGELMARTLAAPLDFQGRSNPITLYGSRFGDTITGSADADFIDGNAGDDVLDGAEGDDTLSGGAGEDTLVGGAGDDALAGGDGADTYYLQQGMGRDVIVENPADSGVNTLQLAAGAETGFLAAETQGDDLFLHFRNSRDGVLIKDYYVGAGAADAWQVRNAAGVVTPLADVIGSLQGSARAADVAAAVQQFEERARTGYASALYTAGYVLGGDGRYRREATYDTDTFSTHDVIDIGLAAAVQQSSDDAEFARASEPLAQTGGPRTTRATAHAGRRNSSSRPFRRRGMRWGGKGGWNRALSPLNAGLEYLFWNERSLSINLRH
jgi:Ca2+-binding RTX toxin-like protein